MKKRMISMLLALALVLSIPVCAVEVVSSNSDTDEYEEFTIEFDIEPVTYSTRSVDALQNDLRDQDSENTERAKDFVRSLELSERGFGYIEEACLQNLERLEEQAGVLTSYSVLLPKTAMATPTYVGSQGGISFYYGKYSNYTKTLETKKYTNREKMQLWINGAANLVLSFLREEIAIPFTVFSSVIDATSYIVHSGAWTDYYLTVAADCYGYYTYVNSSYKLCYSCETGRARPYLIFHTNDINNPGGRCELQPEFSVSTANFGNHSVLLLSAYALAIESNVAYDSLTYAAYAATIK